MPDRTPPAPVSVTGRTAYDAYAESVAWATPAGRQMAAWEHLPLWQRNAWSAAVSAVMDPPADTRLDDLRDLLTALGLPPAPPGTPNQAMRRAIATAAAMRAELDDWQRSAGRPGGAPAVRVPADPVTGQNGTP